MLRGLAFLGAGLLFLLTSESAVGLYDEGVMLTGALRVLHGDLPSRDFFANYGPGQFWVLATAFWLFGATVLVARVYDAAVCAAIVVLAYAWTARSQPRWLALACALCLGALLVEFRLACSPIQLCLLLSLAAALRLCDALAADAPPAKLAPISAALGLLLVCRYDIAPLVAATFGLAIVAVELSRVLAGQLDRRAAIRRLITCAGVLSAGPLVAAGLLAALGVLGPALEGLSHYSGAKYVANRSLPWPGLSDLRVMPLDTAAVYAPPLAAAIGLLTLARARRAGLALHAERDLVAVLVFTVITACDFTKGFVRTSGPHMVFANVPATVLVSLCVPRLLSASARTRRAVTAVATLFTSWVLVRNAYSAAPLYRQWRAAGTSPALPALSCFRLEPARLEAAAAIVAHTDPSERIHSATGRHDKIFAGDMAIYFVTQRLPATRWHHYEPGVQTTPHVQREIIAALEEQQVRWVLVDPSHDQVREPNLSALSSGVHQLDRYLRARYAPAQQFGHLVLAARK